MPPVVTVIVAVVAPVFHNKAPDAVADRVELAQLLVAVTSGDDGTVFGDAVLVPAGLGHPLMV